MTDSKAMATLLIFPSRPLGGDTAAVNDIAGVTGLTPLDVRMKVATGRAGVLLRSPERARLDEVAGRLRSLGHSAVVVMDDEVKALPTPVAARGVTMDGSLGFVDESGRLHATIPAGTPTLVVMTHLHRVQPVRVPMNPGLVAAPDLAAVTALATGELRWLTETDREGLVIDVAWNGGQDRVRLRGEKLVFATLGDAAAPSAALNIRSMLARLLSPQFHPTLDLEFEQFQPPRVVASGSGRARHGDGANARLDRITSERDSAWDSYVRFVVAAWRAGLFDQSGAVVSWENSRPRLTRSAATGPSPDRNAARTPREERAVLVSGSVNLPSLTSRVMNRLGEFGPAGLVGTLVVAMAGAIIGAVLTERARPWPELIAGSTGLLGLTHALTLFDRRRRVENIPTSRIRSAAVGPCEIHGHARAALPLRTPYSQMPCVWYEFRMVRRDSDVGESTAGSPGFHFRVTGEKPHDRVQIVTGHSNDHPFYIEDETGRLEINPTGAQVEVSTVQKLNQVPFAGAPLPPGTRVEITERYIPVDQPIWVMGHLQVVGDANAGESADLAGHLRAVKADPIRMAVGDENGDGVVDTLEWQSMADEIKGDWELSRLTGTGRTDRLVLGRSSTDGFFYITERSEKVVVRRFLWRAILWLAIGASLLIWALLSLQAAGAAGD
ncbi:MAG: GIDE domain-containing protein [Candidatus Eisenbacteria bacterium]|nr:GIDE domain-containing protein [Candidatus Eisenbacteria bacterium]